MLYLGDFAQDSTVCIPFASFKAADGSSLTMTGFAAGDVLIFKDLDVAQRSSSAGITAITDFDSRTGLHGVLIDLSDDTDADFYEKAHEYQVAIDSVTIDGQTVRFWAACFSIEREGTLSVLGDLLGADAIEDGVSLIQALKVILAAAAGKASVNTSTGVVKYRNVGDTKDVITATTDAGERTDVSLDLS
jgi:hypothetical protein